MAGEDPKRGLGWDNEPVKKAQKACCEQIMQSAQQALFPQRVAGYLAVLESVVASKDLDAVQRMQIACVVHDALVHQLEEDIAEFEEQTSSSEMVVHASTVLNAMRDLVLLRERDLSAFVQLFQGFSSSLATYEPADREAPVDVHPSDKPFPVVDTVQLEESVALWKEKAEEFSRLLAREKTLHEETEERRKDEGRQWRTRERLLKASQEEAHQRASTTTRYAVIGGACAAALTLASIAVALRYALTWPKGGYRISKGDRAVAKLCLQPQAGGGDPIIGKEKGVYYGNNLAAISHHVDQWNGSNPRKVPATLYGALAALNKKMNAGGVYLDLVAMSHLPIPADKLDPMGLSQEQWKKIGLEKKGEFYVGFSTRYKREKPEA